MYILLTSDTPLIFQFIQGIFNAWKSFFDLLVSLFNGFGDAVQYLFIAQTYVTSMLNWLPDTVLVLAVSVVVVAILYKVLGREG